MEGGQGPLQYFRPADLTPADIPEDTLTPEGLLARDVFASLSYEDKKSLAFDTAKRLALG